MDSLIPATTLIAAVIIAILFYTNVSSRHAKNLPPGPARLPVIGNAHQMPTEDPWWVFAEWGRKYGLCLFDLLPQSFFLLFSKGDIVHVDVFGKPMIIINSAKVAKELLEKRSAIYSGRPHFVSYRSSLCMHACSSYPDLPASFRFLPETCEYNHHFFIPISNAHLNLALQSTL